MTAVASYGSSTVARHRRSGAELAELNAAMEVDAIPAPVLRELVRDAITQHIDGESYRLTRITEDSEREVLQRIAGWAS